MRDYDQDWSGTTQKVSVRSGIYGTQRRNESMMMKTVKKTCSTRAKYIYTKLIYNLVLE